MPRVKPSTIKGRRIKPLVAPTIFIMAISLRRSYMASLTVLEMISREITKSTAIRAAEAMCRTSWMVVKPSASS